MKTFKSTSKSASIKRLQSLNVNKSTMAHKVVSELLGLDKHTRMVFGNIIRPVYTSGSGRFISNQDHTFAVTSILNQLGLAYVIGNDSKRGGKCGTFIKIITKINDK